MKLNRYFVSKVGDHIHYGVYKGFMFGVHELISVHKSAGEAREAIIELKVLNEAK